MVYGLMENQLTWVNRLFWKMPGKVKKKKIAIIFLFLKIDFLANFGLYLHQFNEHCRHLNGILLNKCCMCNNKKKTINYKRETLEMLLTIILFRKKMYFISSKSLHKFHEYFSYPNPDEHVSKYVFTLLFVCCMYECTSVWVVSFLLLCNSIYI